MRAEHAPVGMHFINDDEMQVAEEFLPVGVMGQDAGVQHVGIGQDYAGALADGLAVTLGSITVVDRGRGVYSSKTQTTR